MGRWLWRCVVGDALCYLTSLGLTWPDAFKDRAVPSMLLSFLWRKYCSQNKLALLTPPAKNDNQMPWG